MERNICCPDIQLLPQIAQLFNVSIDKLLKYAPPLNNDDIILLLKEKLSILSEKDKADFTFKTVTALHTLVLTEYMEEKDNPSSGWDVEDAMEHAAKSEWGYSSICSPELTTTMRKSSVFFSNNQNISCTNTDINRICGIIKVFSAPDNLKTASALY